MCGISGIIHFDPARPVDRAVLEAMNNRLAHRGPDDAGYHLAANCGLGHKRLSVIDVTCGQQPIFNEDGTLAIVFNGEIYNYRDLRLWLQGRGHVFKTQGDTETIIHLYEEKGERCVDDLRGMFAFAIWNTKTQELFCARDRVGKKPFYYHADAEGICFSSEMKALLADPAVARDLNPLAVHDFLTLQYVPDPETIFAGIRKLPPAHTLTARRGKLELKRYWDIEYEPKGIMTEEMACEQTRAHIEEAVKIRLESEVPLGCLLSGGIDSSAVVAYMRRHVTGPLRTFSIGFPEKSHNELPYARIIAEKFATEHEEFIVEPKAADVLPKLVWFCDEPFGDPSALPMYYVSEITRRHVTVALNGDGGDESFAGYERYAGLNSVAKVEAIPEILRSRILRPALGLARALAPGLALAERAQYLNNMSLMDDGQRYIQYLTIFNNAQKVAMYTPEFAEQVGTAAARAAGSRVNGGALPDSQDIMLRAYERAGLKDTIDRKLNCDVHTYLPGDLLVKADRMTMAHALEGRSPFLDHKLMEFAARIPGKMKFKGGVQKYLLKKALEPMLPHEILYREKQGFAVPLADWFRGELKNYLREIILSPEARARGFFKPHMVERLVQQHTSGAQNHYHRLWLLLVLELWCREFLK